MTEQLQEPIILLARASVFILNVTQRSDHYGARKEFANSEKVLQHYSSIYLQYKDKIYDRKLCNNLILYQ